MTSYRALYYPYIHFRDEGWVRAAALYWDQLARIVPYGGYLLKDSASIEALREAGFIDEFEPMGADAPVSEAFRRLVDEWKVQLKERYSIERARETAGGDGQFAGPETPAPGLAYVSVGKMQPDLIMLLAREGLADTGQRDAWVGMHPRMVAVYMTALAQAMAIERGAVPMTNETLDHVSVGGPDVEHIAAALLQDVRLPQRDPRDIEEAMVSVALESVLPAGLADMPIDEVIALRTKFAADRTRFQDGMSELVSSLSHLEGQMSEEDFDWHVRNEYEKRVQVPLDELSQSLHENRVETVVGLIGTQFGLPAGIGALLGAVGVVLAPPVGVALGVAWASWRAHRRMESEATRLERQAWPAYLLKIKGELDAGNVATGVRDVARAVEGRART